MKNQNTNMKTISYALKTKPVITSIVSDIDLEPVLRTASNIVFLLTGNIFTLKGITERVQDAGKLMFVHLDLMEGLGKDAESVRYLAEVINVDGIVTTRSNLIQFAQKCGLISIQRLFVFDSVSLDNSIRIIKSSKPDAIEVLPGIVVAYLVTRELSGVHMLVGAAAAGLLTAVLVQWLHARGVQQEASIGVVFTALFAIGVVLIATKVGNVHLDVQHALMGDITFIPWERTELPWIGSVPEAVVVLTVVFVVLLAAVLLFYKEWKITSFDAALAASLGIPVALMHYVFMTLVSMTAVAAFDAVGAVMVVAMLITPAAAAYLWTDRLSVMMARESVVSNVVDFVFAEIVAFQVVEDAGGRRGGRSKPAGAVQGLEVLDGGKCVGQGGAYALLHGGIDHAGRERGDA